ncbi:MAG TPA: hypothetical protein VFY05_02085 [Candidatus Angelobacter sp.]|nr:hypothetical protein [Candidatus Angelobacter sp.]
MIRMVSAFLVSFVLIGLVACGGGGSTPPPPTPTPALITVTPGSASVPIGGSQTFTSSATGVTWSVSGPGSINQSGVYLAPTTFPGVGANTATITAIGSTGKATASAAVVYPNDHQSFQSGNIELGTSGGNQNDTNATGCCIGTLGSLLNRGGNLFILSNNHVLGRSGLATSGEVIDQPGPQSCFPQEKLVANFTQSGALKPTAGSDPANCSGSKAPLCGKSPSNTDASIAAVAIGEVDATGAILDLGAAGPTSIAAAPPSSTPFVGTPAPGQAVAKSGRTSALTCSTIQGVGGTFRVSYDSSCGGPVAFDATFSNQIIVNGANFIEAGDSGSLLITSDTSRALGLLFAAGSSGAVANPIGDVFAALTNASGTPALVGGPDHAVSCVPTESVQSTEVGNSAASTLAPQQQQAAVSARDRHMRVLMADPAIKAVNIGASADSAGEAAVVIHVNGTPKSPIPVTLDGVRTKVIYAQAPPPLTKAKLESALAVKEAHSSAVMSSPGIQGIAVGRSDDDPAEPAILIYTITGVSHPPIAQVIDGVRTKIMDGSRFEAK